MAWKLHFDGREIAAIDNASHDRIVDQLTVAAQTGAVAWVEVNLSAAKFDLLWTPGAALYFEEFDEAADDAPARSSKAVIKRIR